MCSTTSRLYDLDELREVLRGDLGIALHAGALARLDEPFLEVVALHAEDDVRVHLDEAPVGVPREALVAGRAGEPLDRRVIEAEVEDRVHHAGHRRARAGTDGDEKRARRVSELLSDGTLDPVEVAGELLAELARIFLIVAIEVEARLGGDREARRDRNADVRHLGQARALAAEQVLHPGIAVGLSVPEVVDPLRHEPHLRRGVR